MSFSNKQLEKRGVEAVDRYGSHFKCKHCGAVWSPNLLSGGRYPRGYWKCPHGCNENWHDKEE
ncbi:MAG: hypothetical protein AB1500_03555 [Bacillota bacterium]